MKPLCFVCGKPIMDSYVMHWDGRAHKKRHMGCEEMDFLKVRGGTGELSDLQSGEMPAGCIDENQFARRVETVSTL